jgi:hypothetical protein
MPSNVHGFVVMLKGCEHGPGTISERMYPATNAMREVWASLYMRPEESEATRAEDHWC